MPRLNRSVMQHSFSEVPRVQIPRSSFNRSHGYKTTFDADYLIPLFVDDVVPGEHCYVPRCSKCGKFRHELRIHWFFTGLYCLPCIQGILYDNRRNILEVSR